MKMTKIMLGGLLAITTTANAMPTQEETKKVEPLVMDLMKDDQVALKSGKKTRVEVAESAMSLADKADTEAAKLLLMKGAFNLYVRAGEFDKAIETLQTLQAAVPDIPPANMANIIESSLRVVPRKNGGQLYRLLDETKLRMRYTSAAKKMEKTLKENPTDRQLRTKLAEHYAYLGKWDQALENFAAAEGKAGLIAKSERDGDATEKVADFWWAYPNGKTEELVRAFRVHAAKLYEDAIADGKISGLNKVQAERRIEEAKEYGEQDLFAAPDAKDGLYCVIDLSGGPTARHYPVSYLKGVPKGGWTDEYKMTKLVLRRIESGSFEYLPGKSMTITKPFYIGIFEVTQRQYELVSNMNPSLHKGDMRPVETVRHVDIRGFQKGQEWPKNDKVDPESFISRMRRHTGLRFDLPTEAQWEYACRAGTKGDFNVDGVELAKLGQYRDNGGATQRHVVVGSFMPNAWGLFDMHGNVWELCLDRTEDRGNRPWFEWSEVDARFSVDPKGSFEGANRISKGGNCDSWAALCRSGQRASTAPYCCSATMGFRLAIQSPIMSAK